MLGLPSDSLSLPPIPRGTSAHSSNIPPQDNPPPTTSDGKRKAPDEDGAPAPESDSELVKRTKPDVPVPTPSAAQADGATTTLAHARAAAAYIPFLSVDSLLPPKMPTKEEMEGVLLELRKRALVDEYFGN
jgi:pre-mRNA-splicing factor ISY1